MCKQCRARNKKKIIAYESKGYMLKMLGIEAFIQLLNIATKVICYKCNEWRQTK